MFLKKKNQYHMDTLRADTTLQSVFAACDKTPPTASVDMLSRRLRNHYRLYNFLVLTAVLLLITFLMPLVITPVTTYIYGEYKPRKATLLADSVTDGVLQLTLSGDGILYEEAYQETVDGIMEPALSFSRETGTICFPYHATDTNIYIPVKNAPALHLLLSPK